MADNENAVEPKKNTGPKHADKIINKALVLDAKEVSANEVRKTIQVAAQRALNQKDWDALGAVAKRAKGLKL